MDHRGEWQEYQKSELYRYKECKDDSNTRRTWRSSTIQLVKYQKSKIEVEWKKINEERKKARKRTSIARQEEETTEQGSCSLRTPLPGLGHTLVVPWLRRSCSG